MTRLNRLFIAGAWRAGADPVGTRNPSGRWDMIGHFAQAVSSQLAEALVAALDAQGECRDKGPQKRHNVLIAIGTE